MRARHLGFGILGALVALAPIGPLIAPLGPFEKTLLRALAGPDALAFPALLLVLMMGVILPSTPLAFWAGLAAVQWIEFFRLTRSVARSTLASPALEAATLQGFGPVWVFRRILWPEIGPMLRIALMLDPAFLFADEPSSRLDPVTQALTIRLMVEIGRESGMAMVIVSHDHALLAAISDRVIRLAPA